MYIQGLLIFVLYVLRHEKVYGKIKRKLPNVSKLVSFVKYTISIQTLRKFSVCRLNGPCINEIVHNLCALKSMYKKDRVKCIE